MVRKILLALFALFALISLMVIFNTKKQESSHQANIISSTCQLDRRSCVVSLPNNQEISFTLQPKRLLVMEMLSMRVDGFDSNMKIKIWFEGRDMEMGKHYMQPVSNKSESLPSTILYKGMIPVCSLNPQMIWVLNAEFMHENHLILVQFQLKAYSK